MHLVILIVIVIVTDSIWWDPLQLHVRPVHLLRVSLLRHTCHILPPSEIDLGLCLAVFAGSGGK